jgi:hypothetical protein
MFSRYPLARLAGRAGTGDDASALGDPGGLFLVQHTEQREHTSSSRYGRRPGFARLMITGRGAAGADDLTKKAPAMTRRGPVKIVRGLITPRHARGSSRPIPAPRLRRAQASIAFDVDLQKVA